ncbi:putative disease resistance RPP13-like protein 1, partial [Mucuna pruriens]
MAGEMFAGALVSTFVQITIDSLASRFMDHFRGGKHMKELLIKLKMNMLSIDSMVDDAEQKQFRDRHIRDWLLMAKDIMLEAEDLLVEIDCQFPGREAESQSFFKKMWNPIKYLSVSSFEKDFESRMQQIIDKLETLSIQKGNLGLKEASGVGVGSGSGSKVSQRSPSTSLVDESETYGRDDDKELIFDWLTSDTHNDNKPSILSIVGMGGLGKTTLAQLVYNDSRIESIFDIKAWVCVSEEFDIFNVTTTILERVTGSTDKSRDLEMIHTRLKENLSGKKFLLVLDDVWNHERGKWEELQKPLVFGAAGSRVLVTTRSQKVASIMRSKEHHLEQLQKDDCWELFAKQAFEDGNPQRNPEFNEIGEQIVEKCKGLPLALKTMGSLLYNKSSVSDWEIVLKSQIWELEDSDILPALALSYCHLPSHLKKCFAYCALFPKGYEFEKESLIHLWMAENFLQYGQQSNKSLEEVGEQYFNDLLSRSFFQPSSKRGNVAMVFRSSGIYVEFFDMHDLLNDLAKYVGEDICFMLDVDKAKSIPKTTRHLSFEVKNKYYFDGFGSFHDTERLRSFVPLDQGMYGLNGYGWHCRMPICELFDKFKFLHVLSLCHYSDLTELPESVSRLKYLRSLDLSWTSIKKLPESTCSLSNLQILKLSYCRDLEELPSDLHLLSNLRRLEFVDSKVRKVPPQLGKLKNLQVMMNEFNVGKSREFGIQRLGELNLHGSLSIEELQNIENPSDALEADLKNKTHLVGLKLQWDGENSCASTKEGEVIEKLQPSEHLKKLSIMGYSGERFPNWLLHNSLRNIVVLVLLRCKYCQSLPPLGLLPFLKDLGLSGLDGIVSIDDGFYGNNSSSFTSLETLQFYSMSKWEKWECESVTGAFPRLQNLWIDDCPKLRGQLPRQLLHLRSLKIYNCEQLDASIPRAPEIHEIHIIDCGKLQFHHHPTTLKILSIKGSNIMSDHFLGQIIPDSIMISLDFFPELESLALGGCSNLQMISRREHHDHLNFLEISDCPRLESLPDRMDVLLPFLLGLKMEDCPKVEWFIDGSLPSNLKEMHLNNCSKLIASLKGALGANSLLVRLGVEELEVESFPEEGLLPLSLTSLNISKCGDLKSLDYKGLCSLSSLKELYINDCPKLQCLPEEGLPKSISYLSISGNCPELKQRCQEPEGEDWGKIAHIHNVLLH